MTSENGTPNLTLGVVDLHPSSNTDLTHSWMTCQQVSHHFRDYVDQVFAEKHIRKAHIDLRNLGSVRLESVRYEPTVRTEFNRFSENKKLAYFKDDGTDEGCNRISGRLSHTVAIWRRQMDFYTVGKTRTPGRTEGGLMCHHIPSRCQRYRVAGLKGRL